MMQPGDDDTVIRPRQAFEPRAADIDPGQAAGASEDTVLVDDTVLVRPAGSGRAIVDEPGPPPANPGTPGAQPARSRRVPTVRIAGAVVPLDRPLIVGRKPAAARIPAAEEPRLLAVPSPSGQISASHVRMYAAGSIVVVEDLRSTNGTVIRVPGRPPERMRSGATTVTMTGTVVDIGDGQMIEILSATPRIMPAEFPSDN